MNLLDKAKRELNDLQDDAIVKKYTNELLNIISKFSEQGHSGASAPMEAGVLTKALSKLLAHKPLQPVQDEPQFWNSIDGRSNLFQHNRNSSVFKEDGIIHHIDGFVWEDIAEDYSAFTGAVQSISSKRKVTLPADIPDPVYVQVQKRYFTSKPTDDRYYESETAQGKPLYYDYVIIDYAEFVNEYSKDLIRLDEP